MSRNQIMIGDAAACLDRCGLGRTAAASGVPRRSADAEDAALRRARLSFPMLKGTCEMPPTRRVLVGMPSMTSGNPSSEDRNGREPAVAGDRPLVLKEPSRIMRGGHLPTMSVEPLNRGVAHPSPSRQRFHGHHRNRRGTAGTLHCVTADRRQRCSAELVRLLPPHLLPSDS